VAELGEQALSVSIEDFLQHLGGQPKLRPVGAQPVVAQQRVVGAEQHAVLQPPGDLAFQLIGQVAR